MAIIRAAPPFQSCLGKTRCAIYTRQGAATEGLEQDFNSLDAQARGL